jgi:glycosyltransferase involved in cell wall biosynthesis
VATQANTGSDTNSMSGNARKPRISVITATRNVESTIARLHASLAAQTYQNFEWVVVDGLSTDSTVSLLEGLTGHSPWLRYLSEPDFGVYDALNKAIRMSTGDYYVVAGADDEFAPDALSNYASWCNREHDPDIVLAKVIKRGRLAGGFHPERAWISHPKVFGGSHSVGMLFKTSLHDSFGYYSRRFPLLADGYFLKTLLHSRAVRFVQADFVAGTFADGGLSAVNKLQVLAETWQIQMLTERSPLLQVLLFLGKITMRFFALRRELGHFDKSGRT